MAPQALLWRYWRVGIALAVTARFMWIPARHRQHYLAMVVTLESTAMFAGITPCSDEDGNVEEGSGDHNHSSSEILRDSLWNHRRRASRASLGWFNREFDPNKIIGAADNTHRITGWSRCRRSGGDTNYCELLEVELQQLRVK